MSSLALFLLIHFGVLAVMILVLKLAPKPHR